MSKAVTEPFISTKEAAAHLHVTPRRVLALITSGHLPATKVGRDWLIQAADLAKVQIRTNGYPKGRPRKKMDSSL